MKTATEQKFLNFFRKEGFYKVKYKGNWCKAEWVINKDHDSSWSCWWIEGEEPKAWGWHDGELDKIDETILDNL